MSRKWLELQLENACENTRIALARARKLRQRLLQWSGGQGVAPIVMDELLAIVIDPLIDELAKCSDELRTFATASARVTGRDAGREAAVCRLLARTGDRITSIERIEAKCGRLDSNRGQPNGR